MVFEHATAAGAETFQGTEAVVSILEGGAARRRRREGQGHRRDPRDPRYVVVADGANSRFGRALGTSRNRSYPLGMHIRTTRARATTSRGSRAARRAATATGRRFRATAGSSRSATGPSTSASGCCPPSATGAT
ncbi:MAG: hypothetical protein R2711_11910 [Acidimicrobiales bacterium]